MILVRLGANDRIPHMIKKMFPFGVDDALKQRLI